MTDVIPAPEAVIETSLCRCSTGCTSKHVAVVSNVNWCAQICTTVLIVTMLLLETSYENMHIKKKICSISPITHFLDFR